MNLNSANLKVGLAALDESDKNDALKNVHITNTGTEASNGWMLARVSLPYQYEPNDVPLPCITDNPEKLIPFLVPAKAFQALKTFKGKITMPVIYDTLFVNVKETNANSKAKFAATDLGSSITPEVVKWDGDYPDFDRVIPQEKEVWQASFDIKLLETLLKIAKATAHDGGGVQLLGYKQGMALKCKNNDTNQTFYGLLMPLRD